MSFPNHDRRTKLSDAQVEEIRRLYQEGMAIYHIAARFAVSTTWVSAIVNGRERVKAEATQ